MDAQTRAALRGMLQNKPELELQELIYEFFREQVPNVFVLQGSAEHGIDLAVQVSQQHDFFRRDYEIAIQVKRGDLGLPLFHRRVLGQLIEATYYPVERPGFAERWMFRRLFLMLTGNLTPEAWEAVKAFNERHPMKIEVFELDDLVEFLNTDGFLERALVLSPPVAVGEAGPVERPPPELGQEE